MPPAFYPLCATCGRPVTRCHARYCSRACYPLCATCGLERVKGPTNRFCSPGCVPREVYAANCRRGRATYAYRRRAILLKEYLDRVSGRAITREDLCELLWAFGQTRYNAGLHVGLRAALAEAHARGVA